jgi:hypothetical protein
MGLRNDVHLFALSTQELHEAFARVRFAGAWSTLDQQALA